MRRDVDLKHAYRLLNHGPTVLVSAAHGGRRNVMAAAWAMPLDFDPPKVAVVVDRSTFTRTLIDAGGEFALSIPCVALADATFAVGSSSGHDGVDKFERFGLGAFAGRATGAPLVDGCVGWLECRLLREPHHADNQRRHDLFLAEVVAAQADARVFTNGRWHFGADDDARRTIHHVAGGAFFSVGPMLQANPPA